MEGGREGGRKGEREGVERAREGGSERVNILKVPPILEREGHVPRIQAQVHHGRRRIRFLQCVRGSLPGDEKLLAKADLQVACPADVGTSS